MRRHASVLLLAAACLASCGFAEKRRALKSCDFSIRDVTIEDVRVRSATVRVDMDVYNPNPIDVIVESMDLCFHADGQCVVRSHNVDNATIPPYAKRSLVVKSDVSYLA